jgi:hypothetical protein
LGKPATSLSRPLDRLLEPGLVRRDVPFGASLRDSKRSLYRIADPFLRFWFRFVEPNRSRLEARQIPLVTREIRTQCAHHVAGVWEDLVRTSIPRRRYFNRTWGEARSWWGPDQDRSPMELDLVAESTDGTALLLGEVKWMAAPALRHPWVALERKADRLALTEGKQVFLGVWTPSGSGRFGRGVGHFGPQEVLQALR